MVLLVNAGNAEYRLSRPAQGTGEVPAMLPVIFFLIVFGVVYMDSFMVY